MSSRSNTLSISPLRTRLFQSGESLTAFVLTEVPADQIHESMILAVTSKIVSLAEDRLVPRASIDKAALIDREADFNLGPIGYGSILTIKEGLLIASAGIDESNSKNGDYILYPKAPFESARRLHADLCKAWKLTALGILLTDSRTAPLRLGVTGISLAHWGFRGLQNKIGQKDLFDRPLQMTTVNAADALAAAATWTMGEADESQPLAILHGANVEFQTETDPEELKIKVEDDMYYPLLKARL